MLNNSLDIFYCNQILKLINSQLIGGNIIFQLHNFHNSIKFKASLLYTHLSFALLKLITDNKKDNGG